MSRRKKQGIVYATFYSFSYIKNLHYSYTPSSSIKFKLEVNLCRNNWFISCFFQQRQEEFYRQVAVHEFFKGVLYHEKKSSMTCTFLPIWIEYFYLLNIDRNSSLCP